MLKVSENLGFTAPTIYPVAWNIPDISALSCKLLKLQRMIMIGAFLALLSAAVIMVSQEAWLGIQNEMVSFFDFKITWFDFDRFTLISY